MTDDDPKPSNVTAHSAGAAQSLAEVLLRSQLKRPSFDALFEVTACSRGLAETIRNQLKIPNLDALFDIRSETSTLAQTIERQFALPSFVANITTETRALAETLQSFERNTALFTDLAAVMRQADRLKEAGWIPHPALPIRELVASETNPQQISDSVQSYVNNNREHICQLLTNRFSTYTTPQGTLQLCNAVIQAHRLELFPLIVPSVFAEIELCARAALGVSRRQHGKKIIDSFCAKINDLPISAFDIVQFHTFVLMEDYVYKSITSDAEVSLPHRHGSQHGLTRFNTSRDCFNAMFLLDFVLQSCEQIQKS